MSSLLLLVACSSAEPTAVTGSELETAQPKLRVALWRKDGCKVQKSSWRTKPLFRKAPCAVEQQMCLYVWDGPRDAVDVTALDLDEAESCAIAKGWDICPAGRCDPAEAPYVEPDMSVSGFGSFGCYAKRPNAPSGGGGGCDACGLVAGGRAWIVYTPRPGETRARLRVHGGDTIVGDVQLPPSGAFYVTLPPARAASQDGVQLDLDVLPAR
jgi:hypothetical protein